MNRLRISLPACTILLFLSSLATAQDSASSPGFVVMDNGFGALIDEGVRSPADPPFRESDAQVETGGPVGILHGCVYNSGGSQFQAVKFRMKRAATVPFDALLYRASCAPDQFLDEFGFGNKISLGKGTWIFWFLHFPGQLNTSGRWRVGKQRSQCVDYQTAPDC